MAQAFRGNAAFSWTDADDVTSERVLRLREPVREPRLAHAQSAYRAESLDKRTVTTFTVGEGVDEFVCRVRYGDDPQGLLDLIKAGTKGRTISYFPDLGNPGQNFDLTLIAPISPLTLGLDPDTGTIAGEQDIELRFRRTDFGAFTVDDYGLNATVLFRLRGGGRVEEGTVARASSGTYITKTGLLARASSNQLRTQWVDLDGDNVRETPAFLVEGARTQLVTDPENFGAWSVNGTPTLTSGQSDPFGGTAAYLVEDNDAGTIEYVTQTVTFTGDGEKAFSLFVKQGTATKMWFRIIRTGITNRHIVIITWTAGVPSLSTNAGSGELYTPERLANGWWRVSASADGVIAGETNALEFGPGDLVASDTGTGYFFGANAWNAVFPSSYQGTAETTRAADSLTFPIGFGPQDDLTVYARLARPVWADASGSITISPYVFRVGSASPSTAVVSPYLLYQAAARTVEAGIDTMTTDRTATASVATGTQTLAMKLASLTGGGTVTLDVGSGYGSASAAATAGSAFSSQVLYVGTNSAAGNELFGSLVDLVIARGGISLQGMQGKA